MMMAWAEIFTISKIFPFLTSATTAPGANNKAIFHTHTRVSIISPLLSLPEKLGQKNSSIPVGNKKQFKNNFPSRLKTVNFLVTFLLWRSYLK